MTNLGKVDVARLCDWGVKDPSTIWLETQNTTANDKVGVHTVSFVQRLKKCACMVKPYCIA